VNTAPDVREELIESAKGQILDGNGT